MVAAVVTLRSDETNNALGEEAEYQHIEVLHPISQVVMSDIRKLRSQIVLSRTEQGDAISALVIAIQLIKETCKKVSGACYFHTGSAMSTCTDSSHS